MNERREKRCRNRDRRRHDQSAVRCGRQAQTEECEGIEPDESEDRGSHHRSPAAKREWRSRDDSDDNKENGRDRKTQGRELERRDRRERDLRGRPLRGER